MSAAAAADTQEVGELDIRMAGNSKLVLRGKYTVNKQYAQNHAEIVRHLKLWNVGLSGDDPLENIVIINGGGELIWEGNRPEVGLRSYVHRLTGHGEFQSWSIYQRGLGTTQFDAPEVITPTRSRAGSKDLETA